MLEGTSMIRETATVDRHRFSGIRISNRFASIFLESAPTNQPKALECKAMKAQTFFDCGGLLRHGGIWPVDLHRDGRRARGGHGGMLN
jgi:hypothetical protein